MHRWSLTCISFDFIFLQIVLVGPFWCYSHSFFSLWCDPNWIFAWTKKILFTTQYYLHTTSELDRTPQLCLSSDGILHFPQLWDSQAISSSFHYCLPFTTLRDHTIWNTNTLKANTNQGRLIQLVSACSRGGRWDQKPIKEQEIQGWCYGRSPGSGFRNGQRAFPRRQAGLEVQKTITYIFFLVCTSTFLSTKEGNGENKVQILISRCDYSSNSFAF